MDVNDHDVHDDDGGVHHYNIFWNGSQMHFFCFGRSIALHCLVLVCFIDA